MTQQRHPRSHETTRQILDALAEGDPAGAIALRTVIEDFGKRGFGMLLLIACIFALIPIPGLAGGLSGPIVILTGIQLMAGMRRPWLPRFVLDRPISREFLVRARNLLAPRFEKIEHYIKPRLETLFDAYAWNLLSGILLALLGILLLAPIPGTNYIFAALILLFVIAVIERDGILLLLSWLAGGTVIAVVGLMSGHLIRITVDLLKQFGGL